jgi:outer membrane protein assembly factor BamA
VPVVFDNFVWFTDDELKAAIRERIPAFDGTIPDAGGATDTIVKALGDLLRGKNFPGRVEYAPSAELSGRNPEHLFAVKGGNLGVCTLSYPGARAVPEMTLLQKSVGILSNEFSRKFVGAYAEGTLLPLYHERGYLRAGFLTPQAKLRTTPDCRGVAVTIEVDEGMAYVWEKAEWAGNGTLSAQELDAALGMKQNEIANGLKIAGNLDAVRKAYGRKGHLTPTFSAAPGFDDAKRRVTFRFKVNEGPQYRMGTLTINGLSERDTNDLKVRWGLQSREIYDASYINEFVKKNVPEFVKDVLRDGRKLGALKIENSVRLNPEKQTVDVTLTIKQ